MARPARYSAKQILDAAAQLVADGGPANATITAIAHAVGAPTGSVYHRFRSRDVLLAELWLRTVDSFQVGFQAALALPEPWDAGLQAALHTPRWVRAHPEPARLLLLHHSEDFVAGEWPQELVQRTAEMTRRGEAALEGFTRRLLGPPSASAKRRARYAVVELPVAAVITHLRATQPPPLTVDALITDAYRGVIGDHKSTTRS